MSHYRSLNPNPDGGPVNAIILQLLYGITIIILQLLIVLMEERMTE